MEKNNLQLWSAKRASQRQWYLVHRSEVTTTLRRVWDPLVIHLDGTPPNKWTSQSGEQDHFNKLNEETWQSKGTLAEVLQKIF